ncbi:MAG TPA: hypothetical protein VJT71_05645 [Pyrinomonadaceae bacterium]|nr:hypothetical protein [Pyrinomonadaceae bacterium]
MLRPFVRLLTLVCFSCCLLAATPAQDISQFDLSTDEGVNAAREAIAGKTLDNRSKRCIWRDPSLPGIVVVGGFAFDYGCRFQGVFAGARYVDADDKSMSRTALETMGWKTANQTERQSLARAWVAKGLLGFLRVLSVKNDDFANHAFQPPQTDTKADGETTVTLWMRMPAGRARGTAYQLREYRFTKDGDFAGSKTLDNFTAPKTNSDP